MVDCNSTRLSLRFRADAARGRAEEMKCVVEVWKLIVLLVMNELMVGPRLGLHTSHALAMWQDRVWLGANVT